MKVVHFHEKEIKYKIYSFNLMAQAYGTPLLPLAAE